MVTDSLLDFVAWVVTTVTSWFPDSEPPAWLDNIANMGAVLGDGVNSMGAWLPISLGFQIVQAAVVCIGVGLLIKGVRIVASFFLAGGGSAG